MKEAKTQYIFHVLVVISVILVMYYKDYGWNAFLLLSFIIGSYKFIRFMLTALQPLYTFRQNLRARYGGQFGPGFALVTGGSQGIGYAIAEQLAKEGFDIILVSRSEKKLQQAKNNLLLINPKIKVEYKSVDLANLTTEQQYLNAFKDIFDRDISILVNNVGYHCSNKLTDNSFEQIRKQVKLNLLPIAILSRLFIQKANKRPNKSGIINLSSIAAMIQFPGCSNYSASKGFDDYLSQALQYEYRNKIDILTVRPGLVTTTMTKNTDSFMHTTPQICAKNAVNALGNRRISYGGLKHSFVGALLSLKFTKLNSLIATKDFANMSEIYKKLG